MMTRALLLLSSLLLIVGCDAGGSRPAPGTDGGGVLFMDGAPGSDGGTVVPPGTDGGPMMMGRDAGPPAPPGSLASGSACNCDSECDGTTANPGACVQGVCMTRATATCASGGSTAECPTGSRCWTIEDVSGGICWPDCDSVSCAGSCDPDGSCVPSDSTTCTASCSEICTEEMGGDGCPPNSHLNTAGDGCVCDAGFSVSEDMMSCVGECTTTADCGAGMECVDSLCRTPPCTATSCGAGTICADSGDCVIDIGTPPPGPPPTACAVGSSGIPDWRCTSNCGDLVSFDPRNGPGYEDYPINTETASDQHRSFIRRDVMMLVRYAAAMVDCQARSWTFGNGGRLGLGDMSEASGAIPGTREGRLAHPERTHVDGHDMDIAYFQTGTANNRLRAICPHTTGGVEQNHCTGDPVNLDTWRSALFIGHLHASPNLRTIGVDGQAALLIESALTQLCSDGWLAGATAACGRPSISYEVTDTGRFWFRFHHHHMHLSVSAPR